MADEPRKTLLLVEDEILISLAETKTLEKLGYTVYTAHTGEEALAHFSEHPGIDLVLMDIDLGPGLDGPETAKEMLRRRNLPVIFFTSHAESETVAKTEAITSYGFVVKNWGSSILDGSIKMAFKLFAANRRLAENEKLFQSFFNSEVVGTAINAPDGRWLHVNDRLCEMLGYTREELLTTTWKDITPPEDLAHEMPRFRAIHRQKQLSPFEKKYRCKDGTLLDVSVSTSIVENPDGTIARFFSIVQDITERKRMEDALRKSELKYRSLIESSSAAIFCVDEKGRYQFTNTIFAETFGKTPDYFIGKSFWDIYPKELADMRFEVTKRVFESGKSESVEVEVPLADRTLYYSATANPIKDEGGRVILNLTYATDITERRLAEEKVKALLAEKELILVEVHHRIKNNMNTISSLLSLQAGALSDPAAIGVLEDARNRVQSMMVLYDKLYQSPDYAEISTVQYLPALVEEIVSNFPNRKEVTVDLRIEDVMLRVGKIQPLGMIVNELLTNTMKYAFDGGKGTITVEASTKGGRVRLVVGDDGRGIPESISFANTTGFGLMLVAGLARQLKGEVRIERNGGTRIVLEFDK